MYNLADLYEKQNKLELAEKYYLIAIENQSVVAVNNLAYLYEKQNRMSLAKKYYLIAVEKNNIPAMYNLADLYEKENKLESSIMYYCKASDNNHISPCKKLASVYKKQNNMVLAKKYYLMAANNHDVQAKRIINKILRENTFDIDFAVKASEHLDSVNLCMLNTIISYIDTNTDPTFNMRLTINMICTKCKNIGSTVFLLCGHPTCTKCFYPDISCSLCGK